MLVEIGGMVVLDVRVVFWFGAVGGCCGSGCSRGGGGGDVGVTWTRFLRMVPVDVFIVYDLPGSSFITWP